MSIRFFHTADLHLESPFKGSVQLPADITEQLRDSTFKAFSKMVEDAIVKRPDFIVIVGDIYDGENRSLSAQYRFQQQLEKLATENIPVIISYGNHDHLGGSWTRLPMPKNVFEFASEVQQTTLHIRGQEVVIHGFSYEQRHIVEAKIAQYPVKEDAAIHIGTLHGSVDTNTEHDVYAPFTIAELVEKKYDYWALGHIHKREILCQEPPIVYAGNMQGRHRKESGEKGYYEVTLGEDAQLQFHKTSVIQYEALAISCETVHHAGDFMHHINEQLEQLSAQAGALIVEIQLTDFSAEFTDIFLQSTAAEWLEALREQQMNKTPFIWINKMDFVMTATTFEENELTRKLFATLEDLTAEELQDITAELLNQPKYAKYLPRLDEEKWQQLKDESEQQLKLQLAQELK